MFNYTCLNPIEGVGLDLLTEEYNKVDDLKDAQAALVRSAAMHDLELPDCLDAVARAGAGVNNIPLDKCAQKGIVVFNTPGANANGVKELVFAGMLLAARDVVGGINWCTSETGNADIAKLAEKEKKNFAGTELAGKKLGVIGLGAIGIKVANTARHFGMEVLGYDPFISVNAAWSLSRDVKHIQDLETIYKECDFITVHVPALDSTKGMINKDAFDLMQDGTVIINCARDILVDEAAIAEALKSGRVKKYVSDFPNPTTAKMEGAIVLPHLGASTEEAEDNCAVMAVQEIRDYLENGNIRNSVNYPACDMGVCQTAGRIAFLHKNEKGAIGQFTSVLGDAGINIDNMSNKSKGDFAYTMMDIDVSIADDVLAKMQALPGVIKARVIK